MRILLARQSRANPLISQAVIDYSYEDHFSIRILYPADKEPEISSV